MDLSRTSDWSNHGLAGRDQLDGPTDMGRRKPFRFGTGCYGARSRSEYFDSIRRIEETGYSILVCPDHLAPILGPLTSLMMAADASSTLRIGTTVLANDFRHPVLVAKEAATLDVLSEGRFELGLGSGDAFSDYEQSGIPMDSPGTRLGRLMESVQIIKGLLSDVTVDFCGTHYTVSGMEGFPKPVQRPHPPLYIGAGSRRTLAFAGREADIIGLIPPASGGPIDFSRGRREDTAQQIEWVRQGAGERFSALELSTLLFGVVITDHPREAAEQMAVEVGVTPELISESIHFLVGSIDGIEDEIQMWRERFGISYVVAQEQDGEALGPVVRRLAGT